MGGSHWSQGECLKLSETFFDSMLTYIVEKVRFVFLFFYLVSVCICSFLSHRIICISCLFHVQQIFFVPAFEPLAKVLTDPDSALNKHLGPHDSIQFDSDDSVRYRIHWDVCIYIYTYIFTVPANLQ